MKINKVLKYIGENNYRYRNYRGIGDIDDNNFKQGVWGKYHSNGILLSKGNYINGKEDGYWEYYHENGVIWYKGTYVNGKKDGYWEYYYSNGEIWKKGDYKNGEFYENK